MKTKLIVLGLSLLGSIVALATMFSVELGFCVRSEYYCITRFDSYQIFFRFSILILLFSTITFFLKNEAFKSWLKFSYIAIPVGFVISFILSLKLHHTPGGFFNMDDFADMMYYSVLYGAYIIGSLIAIYRGYKQSTVSGAGTALGRRV